MLRMQDGRTDPNPVVITPSNAFVSSKQVYSRLLCADCEGLFHSNGENYVMDQCAHPNGQFELRELLQMASPLSTNSQTQIYNVQSLLRDKLKHYIYFASSIFWRACAHDWLLRGEAVSKQKFLDPDDQEQFRLYLHGEAAFPRDAYIWVCVSSEAPNELMIVMAPCIGQDYRLPCYKFYFLGLLFMLFLGKDIPRWLRDGALNGSRSQMWISPLQNNSLFNGFMDRMKTSRPSGKLSIHRQ